MKIGYKKENYYPAFLVIVLLAFSCKKDPVPDAPNAFSASVNGSAFVASSIAVTIGPTLVPGARGLDVFAKDKNDYQISLTLHEYDDVKATFNLDNSTPPAWDAPAWAYYSEQDFLGGTNYYSKSGQINIASFDTTNYKPGVLITGTFQFETDDNAGKYSITNGHFSLLVPPN